MKNLDRSFFVNWYSGFLSLFSQFCLLNCPRYLLISAFQESILINSVCFSPNVELRLNLIHAYDAVLNLHGSILKRNMPLSHLRVFFCETVSYLIFLNP